MQYFWTHRENIPDGVGFGQFTFTHMLWVVVILLMVAIIAMAYKRASYKRRVTMRRAIAVILFVSEIVKLIALVRDGVAVSQYLPLEICSFAAYSIILDSLFPENKFFPAMLVILFLPAAIMSLLFPTVTPLPAINFFTIHQFVFHGLIVSYVVARFSCGEVIIDYPDVWKSILKICVVAAVVYLIDINFNMTYMFLTDTYGNPLLDVIWNLTGGGVAYTLGLVLFVIVVVHIFFFIFKGIMKLTRMGEKTLS